MDTYEATQTVMSRIQNLDPENASKIMGFILIQDQGDKEMIRLAFSPEALLLSYINQAKARLGLASNNPIRPNNPFPQNSNSPRIMIPNKNGFNLSNPSSPFPRTSPRPISYANVSGKNGSSSSNYGGNNDFGDEFLSGVQDQLSFFDDSIVDPIMSPSGRSDSLIFPYGEDVSPHPHPNSHPFHRRSCSVNDAAFLANLEEGGGFGWRPCMYFARGFCKNGNSCKFSHSDFNGGEGVDVGSPSQNGSGFDELLRMKALQQQQRFALMASGGHHHPFGFNKSMDFLNDSPRGDFPPMGFGSACSSARQIYLTFPADSTFKEDDVSGYFNMFGPVQDVRIPYQQKRMFGFVTFVYPETVKQILAKGNPHFVCDSRVLVKPYKEKGKVRDKKHMERGDFAPCLSPSGIDAREHFDLPFGSRMLFNSQEMMLRRKLEQEAELQHAIELQGRRMMDLQLMELKNQNQNHHFLQNFPMSAPTQSRFLMNQNFNPSDAINQEQSEEFNGGQETATSPPVATDEKLVTEGTESSNNKNVDGGSDLPESFEHVLPDNLFSSPTKSAAENASFFSQASTEAGDSKNVKYASSNMSMASLKSCFLQMPRFSSGHEVVEM